MRKKRIMENTVWTAVTKTGVACKFTGEEAWNATAGNFSDWDGWAASVWWRFLGLYQKNEKRPRAVYDRK